MIVKSTIPELSIPNVSVTEYALRHAGRLGDKPALIDGPSGRTLTYAQLAGAIRTVAAGLAARGFSKGDVFAIYCPNIPEYAVIFNAVAMLGGINTTINPLYTPGELANQLNDSKARFLVTVPPFLAQAREAAAQAAIEEIFVFGEGEGATPFSALMEHGSEPPSVRIDPGEDLVVLPYSSGTTGLPKGVMLTHRNLVANMEQCLQMPGNDAFLEDDTVIAVLPFFHIYGMVVVMKLFLAQGATVVTMPKFDMVDFLETVQKYKVTVTPLVPPIVLGLAKAPVVEQYDHSSLRVVFCGAAPLGEGVAREASSRLKCQVMQGYGMTEASPVTHLTANLEKDYPLGSIGKVVPATEVKIVDIETGAALGPNEEGELLIRGPQIMKGYLNKPGETAEAIDREGWYHSGDIGYFDEGGHFYIADRLKELIKYKGMQVAPAELEALLLTHEAVLDAAVIPSPDEEAGEVPKAYLVLRGEVASPAVMGDEIMAWVAERVAPHKRIRKLEFIEQVPKSASGKILRRMLVEQERAGSG